MDRAGAPSTKPHASTSHPWPGRSEVTRGSAQRELHRGPCPFILPAKTLKVHQSKTSFKGMPRLAITWYAASMHYLAYSCEQWRDGERERPLGFKRSWQT
jgi:hypothetical protein